MSLVRMLKDGQPKYIRATDIVDIGWADDDHECGACTVTYKDGGFAVVDGTPDEVFKALLNPPEMVLKEDVGRVLDDIDAYVSEVRRDPMQMPHLVHCIAVARRGLGLPPREQ